MHCVESSLKQLVDSHLPFVIELGGGRRTYDYAQVLRAAGDLQARLLPVGHASGNSPSVGVICENSVEFVICDLALLGTRLTEVPVPLSFSAEQAQALLQNTSLCLVDAAGQRRLEEWRRNAAVASGVPMMEVDVLALDVDGSPLRFLEPKGDWVCKVIHTSGTTSSPKGVRVRAEGLDALIEALIQVMPDRAFARSISLVPFSLLIEQVTALYMTIMHGGELSLLPPNAALIGTAPGAAERATQLLAAVRPTGLVATPALLDALVTRLEGHAGDHKSAITALFGQSEPPLLCCGGAPAHPETLSRLSGMGVPVYEGYGLSENSSVVCWNRPGACKPGSVGQPLPHVEVRRAPDGELLIRSPSLFAGYTQEDPTSCALDPDGFLHTGDLAEIDADGFVTIVGRKKSVIITSAGRNVSPEWVEASYAALPFVRAVAVLGDRSDTLRALILVDAAVSKDRARVLLLAHGAERLSDIERVRDACILPATAPVYARYFTVTGRPRRDHIANAAREGALRFEALDAVNAVASSEGRGPSLVVASDSDDLETLDSILLTRRLATTGHLLLRGFSASVPAFSALVKRLSARVTLDPARSLERQGVAQKVDAGQGPIGLHLENGNSPFGADLTWFYCAEAARWGSETTLCDGVEVWNTASAAAREHFAGRDILYTRRVEEAKWKTFVFHRLGGEKARENITVEDLLALANDANATRVTVHDNGDITYAYRTPAAGPTRFGKQTAWANSIFGPSYNYQPPTITFADGSPIDAAVLEEMRHVTEQLTIDIAWRDGDIALIDNTRVMHGRRCIEDDRRLIYNAQSYIRPELVSPRSARPYDSGVLVP